MRSRVFKLALAGVVLAGSLLCVLVLLFDQEGYLVKLADGSEVRVLQITYGREHRFLPGPPWQRLLKWLPTKLATRLGVPVLSDTTPVDTLVVWLEWRNQPKSIASNQKLRVVDTNGLYALDVHSSQSITKSNSTFTSFQIPNFPRHQSSLQFQWFVAATAPTMPLAPRSTSGWGGYVSTAPKQFADQPAAQFRVRNPSIMRNSLPGIARFPNVAQADGERFELLAIHSGLIATGVLSGNFVSNQCTEILFRIGTNNPGSPSPSLGTGDWSIRTVELFDLFGNQLGSQPAKWRIYATGADDYRMRSDDGIARIPSSLWAEQDWNVRATFARLQTDSLPASHRWTTSIAVPAIGTRTQLSITGHVYGCNLKLESMDNVSWVLGRGFQNVGPVLSLNFVAPQRDWRLVVLAAKDQNGSNIVCRPLGEAQPRRFQFCTTGDSRSLKLTFGVLPLVTVELCGKASIVRSNRNFQAIDPDR
ncbi:MAG TPA: hypothetical protein VMZ27_07935 [Candidatus Saccharimonadales bacterium]|nr:hypothetical protein [Candidatus Saccharimonadales bacterium]